MPLILEKIIFLTVLTLSLSFLVNKLWALWWAEYEIYSHLIITRNIKYLFGIVSDCWVRAILCGSGRYFYKFNGYDAIKAIEKRKFDFIVVDLDAQGSLDFIKFAIDNGQSPFSINVLGYKALETHNYLSSLGVWIKIPEHLKINFPSNAASVCNILPKHSSEIKTSDDSSERIYKDPLCPQCRCKMFFPQERKLKRWFPLIRKEVYLACSDCDYKRSTITRFFPSKDEALDIVKSYLSY
jgi:hypothetical protein